MPKAPKTSFSGFYEAELKKRREAERKEKAEAKKQRAEERREKKQIKRMKTAVYKQVAQEAREKSKRKKKKTGLFGIKKKKQGSTLSRRSKIRLF